MSGENMNKSTAGTLYLLFAIILSVSVFASEPIDRIVAVIGKDPIMASELAPQLQLISIQNNIRPQNQEELDRLQREILNQMISEKLFLIEARKDTSINITDDEINQAVDQHIAQVASQFESEDDFLTQLSVEGLSLRSFKKRLRPEIENQLLKQRLIGLKLNDISISRQEVNEFYREFRDSLPDQPEAIRLAHILITFQPSGGTEDSVKSKAEKVRENAVSGADFPALSMQYSSGPNAVAGGDLGFISRQDVIEEFSRVAFNLQPGEISSVVRTPMGYHIVKCEEIREDKSHLRHILFDVRPTAADSALSYILVDSLLNEIRAGADFKELAKIFSADDESRKQGGELGWFAIADLPPGIAAVVDSMSNVGDIYGPARTEYGLHILKKMDWQEGHKLTLETDFDQIKEMARQSKTGEYVDAWLERLKEKTYVEIRLQ